MYNSRENVTWKKIVRFENENSSEISDQNENVRFTFLTCMHNVHLNSTRILEVKTVLKSAD